MCLETATAAASEEGPTLPKLTDVAVWHEHTDGLEMKLHGDTEDICARSVRIGKVLHVMGELYPLFRDEFRICVYDTSGEEVLAKGLFINSGFIALTSFVSP